MQGGAADGPVRLRKAVDACKCDGRDDSAVRRPNEDDALVSLPLDTLRVEDEILISPLADAMLERARELFALSVALPIAWVHLDFSVAECRDRKHKRVRDGAEQVLRLQQAWRAPAGDWYFSFWSFCAEEEFYLLTLPPLFWNVDYRFARHMTAVVCGGLLWGNLLKDVFRLPRPVNVEPRVWVPHAVLELDSTACRDFGYPSTHAMNAVSNSLFTVLYCLQHQYVHGVFGLGALVALSSLWVFSIAFGRLYLGVHSPMDVKGGLLQGAAVALIAQRPLSLCDRIDRWLLTMPHVGAILALFIAVVLVLNPQPRPMTPTFMQNCTLCGLLFGTAAGFRMETDRRGGMGARPGSNDVGVPMLLLRTLVGFAIVLLARVLFKKVFVTLFRAIGLQADTAKLVPRKEAVHLAKTKEIKGWDLWAAAVSKTGVYALLAWTITCGCPAFFEVVLGVSCEMNA